MSLTNAQYDAIMREYERRSLSAQRQHADHIQELTDHLPGYREADQALTDLAIQGALRRSGDPAADLSSLKSRMAALEQQKKQLMQQPDILQIMQISTITAATAGIPAISEQKNVTVFSRWW